MTNDRLKNAQGLFAKVTKIVLGLIGTFILVSFLAVLYYKFFDVRYTPLMISKSGKELNKKTDYGIDQKWVDSKQMSSSIKKYIIRAEDHKFYEHNGFDFEAIKFAYKYNKTHKNKKGASTISQQTAKNVFLWPSRSWIRKGLEAYFTVLIELMWSKDRILEVYLNVIEFGPGTYGVEAAAKKYFRKPAKQLNARESALMAAVLPNPIRFKISNPSSYVLKRQKRILGSRIVPKISEADIEKKEEIKLNDQEKDELYNLKFEEGTDFDSVERTQIGQESSPQDQIESVPFHENESLSIP